MTVGQRIKKRREELGMSMSDLARALGKNRSTISRYESEVIDDMPISVIPPLARALKTRPEYLMGWVDEKEESLLYDEESEVLRQYRSKPEMQAAVKVLLGIKEDE